MNKIINATQHNASPEQIAAGVIEMSPEVATLVRSKSTFDSLPTREGLVKAAEMVASALLLESEIHGTSTVMIGGAPFFMGHLELALSAMGLKAVYAFSQRVSVDKEDGTKVSVFKHLGFVEA